MIRFLRQHLSNGLVSQAVVYIAAAAANAVIPFLLLPLIARWLGPADFGVIGSFVAIVNVLILLVGLNAYGFVSVGYYRDGAQTLPRLVGAAVAIILSVAVVIAVGGWIGAGTVERLTQIDDGWLWTLLAAATGQAIISVALTVAQTIKRPAIYASFQIGYGLSLGISAVVLVGVVGMGWPGRALAQAMAALLVAMGALVWLRASRRITIADRATLRRALRFGVPLLPHSFAAVAMGSMDRLALSGNFAPAVVGHYFLALQISSVFTALAAAVNQAWVPWLYERLARNDNAAWAEITRTIRMGGALLILGAVVMALLAQPLVLVLGGISYLPAIMPLRLLAFYAAGRAWYTLMSAFLFYGERIRSLSALTTSVAVLQAALIAALVRWGATGVAGALVASTGVAALAISVAVWRLVTYQRSLDPTKSAPLNPATEAHSSFVPPASKD